MDIRQQRTRKAVLRAFFDLLRERPYDEIRVGHIVGRAGNGRSTFYEHFDGKDGVLAASIAAPFAVLADTLGGSDDRVRLLALLDHFRANRVLARTLLTGSARRTSLAVLVSLVEARLAADGHGRERRLIVPLRLAALQLAEILLVPTTAWLTGESRCSADTLAATLRRVGVAALQAMRTERIVDAC